MRILQRSAYLAIAATMFLTSCKKEGETEKAETPNEAEAVISEIRTAHAPDKRVALFDVETQEKEGTFILKGESNLPEAVSSLKKELQAKEISFVDSIQMLPSKELQGRTQGVIKISVANLRARAAHSSELVTQATMGTPVKVYKKDGDWYYVQTPDGYLAWVDSGGVIPIDAEEFSSWKAAEKVVFLDTYGFSHEKPSNTSQPVSDLTAGNILEVLGEEKGFYKVRYPHGREAFIERAAAQPYGKWLASLEPSGESLIETSMTMMGVPYLWGGTSPKGVDCSGYTKTIFFLNGIILPRDASQQVHTGVEVDTTRNFENLLPGDLLFFGRKATDTTSEKIIHVGMWIGDNKFIHAMGDVHISTMDTTAEDFDEYNYNRYLRTKRVLGQQDGKLIQLKKSELFLD